MKNNFKILRLLLNLYRLVIWVFFILIVILSSLWILLQTNTFQNYLVKKTLAILSTKTHHKITLQNVKISGFNEFELKGLKILDNSDNSLVETEIVLLNIDIWNFLKDQTFTVTNVILENGVINITKYSEDKPYNLVSFLDSFRKDKNEKVSQDTIAIERIFLDNIRVNLHAQEDKDVTSFRHYEFLLKWSDIGNLKIFENNTSFQLFGMKGHEAIHDIDIEKLESKVEITPKRLTFTQLDFNTKRSRIRDSLIFSYDSFSQFSSFADSVTVYLSLDQSIIDHKELEKFINLDILKNKLTLSLKCKGKIKDLQLDNISAKYGKSSLRGHAKLKNIQDSNHAHLSLTLQKGRIYYRDIAAYNPRYFLNKKGYFSIAGTLNGKPKDFKSEFEIQSQQGNIKADLAITRSEKLAYSGHIDLQHFDLGYFLNDTIKFQKVNLKGKITGSGIHKSNAAFLTEFTATDLGILGYDYDSITFKGFLAAKHFYGRIQIEDPHCKLNLRGNVDLRNTKEKVEIQGRIDTLFTKKLHWLPTDYFVSTQINWDQTHLDLDSIMGYLKLSKTVVRLAQEKELKVDFITISSEKLEENRITKLNLPGGNMALEGSYSFSDLNKYFQRLYKVLKNKLLFSDDEIENEKIKMHADFYANFRNINPIGQFFFDDFYLSEGASFTAQFTQDFEKDATLYFVGSIDSLQFNRHYFLQNKIDFHSSLSSENSQILSSFLFKSKYQKWNLGLSTENFQLDGFWNNNEMELYQQLFQKDTKSKINLNGSLLLQSDSIYFKFNPSSIKSMGKDWILNENNSIKWSKSSFFIQDLDISSQNKKIAIEGVWSDSIISEVNLLIQNLQISPFKFIVTKPFSGEMDVLLTLFKAPSRKMLFSSNINVKNFTFNNKRVGNLTSSFYGDSETERLQLWLGVENEKFRTLSARGHIFNDEGIPHFDINLMFDHADLKFVEMATQGVITDIHGFANGKVRVFGNREQPIISGGIDFLDGGFFVNFLQTRYTFSGPVLLDQNILDLKNLKLVDNDGDEAKINGKIVHHYFRDFHTDLQISAQKFQFLNTTSVDHNVFYGTAVATGNIFITGPFDDLMLKVVAKTERGTHFHIPLYKEKQKIKKAEFVKFVNKSDTSEIAEVKITNKKKKFAINLNMELEVTNDAFTELIFNYRTGDIIRGNGNGNLNIILDKKGNFELYGPLTINKGAYNFTVPGFLNKQFDVMEGGKITWFGDPYAAEIDLSANYKQQASFSVLYETENQNTPNNLNQRYPVWVLLHLNGKILTPELTFDIEVDNSIAISQEITRMLTLIKSNEQELKRQVVSLMFLNRFSPLESSFVGGGTPSLGASFSELLTNQISYIISQWDENLEFDIDLTNLDKDGLKNMQLSLGYNFMDGRLKITRQGDFTKMENENTNIVNDIIGNLSVEYLLTEDGKLIAKVFSRYNQNTLNNEDAQNTEQGVSLKYFNSFNGWLKKNKN